MSIVAVHGPYTFGSKGIVEAGPVQATPNPANGLIWTFKLDGASTRVAADFDWVFTGGTVTPQNDTKTPTPVTYATPGAKTATLTVTGAGTGANPYPPAGVYNISVTAVSGAAPQLLMAPGGEEDGEEAEVYDPGDYTVDEVKEYVEAHPDEVQAVYDAEVAGKNRVTLVTWLTEEEA